MEPRKKKQSHSRGGLNRPTPAAKPAAPISSFGGTPVGNTPPKPPPVSSLRDVPKGHNPRPGPHATSTTSASAPPAAKPAAPPSKPGKLRTFAQNMMKSSAPKEALKKFGKGGAVVSTLAQAPSMMEDMRTLEGNLPAQISRGAEAVGNGVSSVLGTVWGARGGYPGAIAGGVAGSQAVDAARGAANKVFGTDIELASETAGRLRTEQAKAAAGKRTAEVGQYRVDHGITPAGATPAGATPDAFSADGLREISVGAGGETSALRAGETGADVRYVGTPERQLEMAGKPQSNVSQLRAPRDTGRDDRRARKEINDRYDKEIGEISTRFGGGVKARAKLNELRDKALDNRASDSTTRRGDDIKSQTDLTTNANTVGERRQSAIRTEGGNNARALLTAGTAQKKRQDEQVQTNRANYEKLLQSLALGEDGKVDVRKLNEIRAMSAETDLQSEDGTQMPDMNSPQQNIAFQQLKQQLSLRNKFNAGTSGPLTIDAPREEAAVNFREYRDPEFNDVLNNGLPFLDWADAEWSPVGDSRVAVTDGGKVAAVNRLRPTDIQKRIMDESMADSIRREAERGNRGIPRGR